MIRKIPLLLVAVLCSVFTLAAQTDSLKYGHMNLGNLLDQMPETSTAEGQLRILADSLNMQDTLLIVAFEKAYAELEKEYNAGDLTPVQLNDRKAALELQQQEIQKYEIDAQKQLETTRNELIGPILQRVEKAINEVAKENGFKMIFDVSTGAMLFAAETIDVTDLVKKKLGILE